MTAVVKSNKRIAKTLHDILHWSSAPIVTVGRVFNTRENIGLASGDGDFFHCIVKEVGLFDLQFVSPIQAIQLVWLLNRPKWDWHSYPQLL